MYSLTTWASVYAQPVLHYHLFIITTIRPTIQATPRFGLPQASMVEYVCSGGPRARAMQPTHEVPVNERARPSSVVCSLLPPLRSRRPTWPCALWEEQAGGDCVGWGRG